MDTQKNIGQKYAITVDLEKGEPDETNELIPVLFKVKSSISTNRDGITVGTNIYCDADGVLNTATVCKNGYVLNGIEYLNLTDLTNSIFGRKVHTNPLKLWYMDNNRTIQEHLQDVLR